MEITLRDRAEGISRPVGAHEELRVKCGRTVVHVYVDETGITVRASDGNLTIAPVQRNWVVITPLD